MIDIFLRTDTAEDLQEACPFLWDEEWITGTEEFALSIIGPVVTVPATYDDDGEELTPAVMDDRFHANLRCTQEIADRVPPAIRVAPRSPVRVWL